MSNITRVSNGNSAMPITGSDKLELSPVDEKIIQIKAKHNEDKAPPLFSRTLSSKEVEILTDLYKQLEIRKQKYKEECDTLEEQCNALVDELAKLGVSTCYTTLPPSAFEELKINCWTPPELEFSIYKKHKYLKIFSENLQEQLKNVGNMEKLKVLNEELAGIIAKLQLTESELEYASLTFLGLG
jgi:hypothetical protein